MISYREGNNKFNFRVAAVIIHDDKVLLHQYEGHDFWAFPGGRAELMENTKETIVREMKEELNEDMLVSRLLWLSEDFYEHMGMTHHEICYYYLMNIKPTSDLIGITESFERIELDGVILTFKWIDLMDLASLDLVPSYTKDKLLNIQETIEHVINNELIK